MRKHVYFIGLIMLLAFTVGCTAQDVSTTKTNSTNLSANETDPAKFKEYFPQIYESYLRNAEASKTVYAGSVKESKYIAEPQLPDLFAGYGFAKEYNEDRGHLYTMEDVTSIKRVNEKTTASCLTCKSTEVPGLIKKYGDEYYKTPFSKMKNETIHPIGCPDCHDPQTMELRVTRPGFIDAMKKRGVDVAQASREDMRTYVCGQCHVEYYFKKGSNIVTYPWENGLEPEEIYSYYQDKANNFSDWTHKTSQTPMLKTQHPEFETWSTGTHGKAGVTCADCHMPYMKDKNGSKISSHWWTSPLKTLDESCLVCHKSQGEDWVKERVNNIQRRTFELQEEAANTLVKAHNTVKDAIYATNPDKAKIAAAQEGVRKAQWYWDWVAAENSRGFHNPEQSIYVLGKSISAANKVILSLK